MEEKLVRGGGGERNEDGRVSFFALWQIFCFSLKPQ
jgi:hypothetical protein